jgi:hypothetical protein
MTEPVPPLWIEAGTAVTVRDGAFASMSGLVSEDWRGKGNVAVTLTIFGRETRIELAPQQLFPCPIPREAEWPEGTRLERMLENVRCHASDRKMRLFGVACCRRIARLMTEVRCAALSADASRLGLWEVIERSPVAPCFLLQTVADVERFAESGDGQEEMQRAAPAAWTLYSAREHFYQWIDESWAPADQELLATAGAAQAVQSLCESPDPLAVARAASRAVYWSGGGTQRDGMDSDEEAAQRQLVRDIFGLPLHLQSVEVKWLTHSVRGIAQAIDTDWPDGLLPVLSDALEDAGCTDSAILEHCRRLGPHVPGCWVVDLLLGKS